MQMQLCQSIDEAKVMVYSPGMHKKIIPVVILMVITLACTLNIRKPNSPTPTPTTSSTPSPVPFTPTSTYTPTPIPTPTPPPAVRVYSGDHALLNGDWDSALQSYQAAYDASSEPDIRTAALLGLGRIRFLSGDYPGALNSLRELVENYPNSPHRPEAFFFLGQTYDALSRYGEAADAYQNYLALRRGVIDAFIYELRGDAEFAASDYPGAMLDYQAALQSPHLGDNIALQIKIARTTAIQGDYTTALALYGDIFNRTDNDYTKARVDFLRGEIYTALGQPDQANAAYLDAVTNFPMAYDAYQSLVTLVNVGYPVDELQRGKVDYYAGEYGVAVAAFDRYLGTSPIDPATAYYYKGLCLRALTNSTAAIAQWDVVTQNYPESEVWDNAWEQKAYTQWAYLDKYTEAEQTLLDFVNVTPGNVRAAEFLFDAARVAERDGRLTEAALTWERVGSEYPDSEYVFRSLFLAGIAHYRQGDYPSAQAAFQRVQGLSSNMADRSAASFWIGKSQFAQGDQAAARATWEITATMDPTGYYSERARDLLLGRPPFTPPRMYVRSNDEAVEQEEAENWMRLTFSLPAETDLSGLGGLPNDPRFQQGQEFWRLGLYLQAQNEFEDLRQSLQSDPVSTYQLARYLNQIGLYRSAILAARQVLSLAGMDDAGSMNAPALFNHIRFGTYFPDLVIPESQAYDFHPLFVWSIIRQESLFESFIRSSADARGLMQIIPSTGQTIAEQTGWPPNFIADDLYRPLVSIKLGLAYLDEQMKYLNGNLYAALAAYNAGPGNASAWKDLSGDDPDLFLEIVRLDEPRRYIQGIYDIFNIYRRLYDRSP